MRKELLKGLTEEQIAKVKSCQNNEEVLAIAKEEGIELTDEQLEAVSGGGDMCSSARRCCPKCYSNDYRKLGPSGDSDPNKPYKFVCEKCGHSWLGA